MIKLDGVKCWTAYLHTGFSRLYIIEVAPSGDGLYDVSCGLRRKKRSSKKSDVPSDEVEAAVAHCLSHFGNDLKISQAGPWTETPRKGLIFLSTKELAGAS